MLKKGIYYSIITAIISGISVFINGFASKSFADPFLFTTMKNAIVAVFLSSILIGLFSMKKLTKLRWQDWLILIVIGLVGGSIPFLLFFKGLSMSTTSIATFLQKTLFIWSTILAFFWLKEKITWHHLVGFAALLLGIGLMSPWKEVRFGTGEILVLIATLLWAIEAVLVRKISQKPDYLLSTIYYLLPWGRMFFGSVFMVIYIGAMGGVREIGGIRAENAWWLVLTSVFLLGYITTWYASLKHAPIVVATSILAIAFPITVILNSIFVTQQISGNILLGLIIAVIAVLFLLRPIRLIGQI